MAWLRISQLRREPPSLVNGSQISFIKIEAPLTTTLSKIVTMPPLVQVEDKSHVTVPAVGEQDGNYALPKSNMPSHSDFNNTVRKSNERRLKRRSVCFDEDMIFIAPQQLQLDSSSISDTWYGTVDYQRFKQECKCTLRQMIKKIREKRSSGKAGTTQTDSNSISEEHNTASTPDEEDYCSIGLENYLPGRLRIRNERRYLLTKTLLECQKVIKDDVETTKVDNDNNTWTPEEYIASRSRYETAKCRLEAQTRGEQLAVQVYQMNWKDLSNNNEDSRQQLISLCSNTKSRAKHILHNVRSDFTLPVLKAISKVAEASWAR